VREARAAEYNQQAAQGVNVYEEARRFFISSYSLPANWQIEQSDVAPTVPLAALEEEIEARLSDPINSFPLTELCSANTNIVIVCDRLPADEVRCAILRSVLARLQQADTAPERVTLLIASPMDDAATGDQVPAGTSCLTSLGDYASRIHVVWHDPDEMRELDEMGNFEGVPLTINYRAAEADLLIALCAVQLDDDPCCAGSCATITLGVVGASTRRELRTTRFYDDRIEPLLARDRPLFQRVLREGARRAGLMFALGALVDSAGRALAVRAGAPTSVDDALADLAVTLRESSVGAPSYDIVLAEPNWSKRMGGSLFDASLAAIHISLARNPLLVRGGSLILPVNRREDDSASVRTFYDALASAPSPEAVIRQLQGRSLLAGEARAYLLAHAMQRYHLIIAGPQRERLMHGGHFLSSPSVREAAELAENFAGKHPRALIVRHALSTVPVFRGPLFVLDPPGSPEVAPSRWN